MAAALGMIGAALCALSPAWGARGYHRVAAGSAALGALLALLAALSLV
ncbi:MAG TPA: hypothetical protein VN681_08765 [Stellaceae bacterium]|nr:hypothetical protein [Stellaceae bacterium]